MIAMESRTSSSVKPPLLRGGLLRRRVINDECTRRSSCRDQLGHSRRSSLEKSFFRGATVPVAYIIGRARLFIRSFRPEIITGFVLLAGISILKRFAPMICRHFCGLE